MVHANVLPNITGKEDMQGVADLPLRKDIHHGRDHEQ